MPLCTTKEGMTQEPRIMPFYFEQKQIAILCKGTRRIALIEALAKLYFSDVNLSEFIMILTKLCCGRLYDCSVVEEKIFIRFYKIKINSLKCSKVICVEDFTAHYKSLKSYFKGKFHGVSLGSITEKPPQNETCKQTTKRRRHPIKDCIDLTVESHPKVACVIEVD